MLVGTIGLGYIVYGRKPMRAMALISGILLCIFPYVVTPIWFMLLIAVVIMVLPRFFIFS